MKSPTGETKRIVVGITGASGAVYARRLVECLAAGGAEDRRVDRRLHEQALSGPGQRTDREIEAGDDAGERHHRLGRDAPAVPLREALGDDVLQLRALREIAEEAVLDARAQRRHDRGW